MARPRAGGTGGETARAREDGVIVWDQEGVVIVWADGHTSRFSWPFLRSACPCAECRTGGRGQSAHPPQEQTARANLAGRTTYR